MKRFRPDDVRLQAIEKSAEKSKVPDNVDYKQLVYESIKKFWKRLIDEKHA